MKTGGVEVIHFHDTPADYEPIITIHPAQILRFKVTIAFPIFYRKTLYVVRTMSGQGVPLALS